MYPTVVVIVGMLAWPVIGILVFSAVLFVLYGVVLLPLHRFIKAEALNDRNTPTSTSSAGAALDRSHICWPIIPDDDIEDHTRCFTDDFEVGRQLPPRAVNRKINPEPRR